MFNNNGVVNGAYFNHTKRVPELNERTSSRNVPSNNFNMSFLFDLFLCDIQQCL